MREGKKIEQQKAERKKLYEERRAERQRKKEVKRSGNKAKSEAASGQTPDEKRAAKKSGIRT